MGNMLLVGYNTYKTLPAKAFEGRQYMVVCGDNPVVSRFDKVYRFKELSTILNLIDEVELDKVFIGGGAMLYESMIDLCDECIITWVNKNYPEGDKRFPIDKLFANFVAYEDSDWQKSKNNILYKIVKYRKIVELNS
jgi:dihydrofolate reductase